MSYVYETWLGRSRPSACGEAASLRRGPPASLAPSRKSRRAERAALQARLTLARTL